MVDTCSFKMLSSFSAADAQLKSVGFMRSTASAYEDKCLKFEFKKSIKFSFMVELGRRKNEQGQARRRGLKSGISDSSFEPSVQTAMHRCRKFNFSKIHIFSIVLKFIHDCCSFRSKGKSTFTRKGKKSDYRCSEYYKR